MAVLTRDEYLQQTKQAIRELSAEVTLERLRGESPPLLIDVREADEVAGGQIDGAVHVPRGFLELRIENLERDRGREIVLYCAGGLRSAFAARSLQEMGYERVWSMSGGFGAWKNKGLPWSVKPTLSPEQRVRYSRHLLLDEVGEAGQLRLLQSKVLLVGAGGLGSPAALYLAAAGVGTIGVVDPDDVDRSNLQRQILHRDADVGVAKVESATRAMRDLNPDVKVVQYKDWLTSANVTAGRSSPTAATTSRPAT